MFNMFNNQQGLEERVLQEINKVPKTYFYSIDSIHSSCERVCTTLVLNRINDVVNEKNVKMTKLALNAKRRRNKTTSEYNDCLENNIVFELYKYDNIINIFNVLENNVLKVEQMDFQTFYMLMLEDSQKKVLSAKHLSQTSQAIQHLLITYSQFDTEQREYEYIFFTLKQLAVQSFMQAVLTGELEEKNQRIATRDFFRRYSAEENKATFDLVITNEIAKRLPLYYE